MKTKEEIIFNVIKKRSETDKSFIKYESVDELKKEVGEDSDLRLFLEIMEEYASQDKWISVKDELPGDYQRVLGYVEEINDLGKSHFAWNVSYSKYHGFLDNFKPCKITHWQPLPNPPKK